MSQRNRFVLAALPAALLAVHAFAASPAWQEGNTYAAGATVSYNGNEYQALVTHTAYVGANWNPASTPTLWKLAGASTGTPTPAPVATPTPGPVATPTPNQPTATPAPVGQYPAWNASTAYTGGQRVIFENAVYEAKWWTQGDNPGQSGEWGVWKKVAVSGPSPTPTVTPTGVTPTVTPPPVVVTPTVTPTPVVVTPTVTPTPVVVTPTVTPTPTPVVGGPTPPPISGAQVGSYFTQWGVYGRGYQVKHVDTSGTAAKLTFINYAFGNLYQKNGGYECGLVNKLEPGATNANDPQAATGGDSWADYQRGLSAADSVDGVADLWGWPQWDDPRNGVSGPLKGNFNQLKKLKAKYPNLKVYISLGGWTWSKWFSNAAKTDALRKQLVRSCIDVYIKGNVPFDAGSNAGGPGTAAGVFDGIDIDWEFPGVIGQPYNTVAPEDKQNFTLLLKEFREQLDAIGATNGANYGLTVAIGAGKDKIDMTVPAEYSKYLDWINVMNYDYNGAWAAQGPTDFQSHLYADPNNPQYTDPKTGNRSLVSYYNTDDSIKQLLAAGVPGKKLVVGLPFYGRGWTGVAAGPNGDGLYQSATGGAKGTYETGIEDYKVLKNAAGTVRVHPVTKQSWKYDGSNWWSYDTPADIALKVNYVKANALGGVFSWSLDGDTANGELATEMAKVRQ
ncbi:MAG TPA: glycosyl hydrolase family 18 protein [Chitinolyticbacter sp.]|nr:glycosyl hydrolase family 18 protein [Chitinolyticbacter sp.]